MIMQISMNECKMARASRYMEKHQVMCLRVHFSQMMTDSTAQGATMNFQWRNVSWVLSTVDFQGSLYRMTYLRGQKTAQNVKGRRRILAPLAQGGTHTMTAEKPMYRSFIVELYNDL